LSDGAGERPAPLPTFRLVLDPTFGPFFIGKLLANLGVWVHQLAAVVVVFRLTGSAAWVGAVGVGQFLPQIFIAPWSGARADQADRRRQLILGRLIGAFGSGTLVLLPVWSMLGDRGAAIAVIAGSTVVGVGFALGGPALHALVPQLVRPVDLPAAITLNTLPITFSRALGPGLGALIVAGPGPETAFLVAALGNLVFALLLMRIRARPTAGPSADIAASEHPIRDGLRHILATPQLRTMLIGVAVIGFATDPVVTLAPSLADLLGGGTGLVGALTSAFGVGAAVGLLMSGPLRLRLGVSPLAPLGVAILAVGFTATAFAPSGTAAILAVGVAGSGMTIGLTSLTTRLQQLVQESFRGRVMSAWTVAFLGTRPLASATFGPLADLAGVRVALATVGVLCAMAAMYLWRSRGVEQPDGHTAGPTTTL
jgi:MFS family permease